MNNSVERWLAKELARQFRTNLLLGAVALVLGIVILCLTLLLTYAVIWLSVSGISAASELILGRRFYLADEWRWTISAGFIVLLIVSAFRNRDFDFGDFPRRRYPRFAGASSGLAAFGILLAYPGASSRMISDLLHTGPRVLLGCWVLILDAIQLRRTAVADCAAILSVIIEGEDAGTWEELGTARPDLDWARLRQQLKRIRGVIYLEKGVTVTPELRKALREIAARGTGK